MPKKNVPPRSYAERLVDILKLFAEHSDVLSVAEIGRKLNLPGSSTHRALEPLVRTGLIERAPKRRYRIGAELYRIALLIQGQFELMKAARPIMIETARLSGETCLLGLLTPNRRRIVLVHKIDSTRPTPPSFDFLENITPAWGSVSRAIMAWLRPSDLVHILRDAGPSPVTGERLPGLATLQEELAEICRDGVACSMGKRSPHSIGVAAPFFDDTGAVRGAIGIVAPKSGVTKEVRVHLIHTVKSQSAQLSKRLGYRAARRRSVRKRAGEDTSE